MAYQLAEQGHQVIFLDNASTYLPLIDWYEQDEFQIVHLPNIGSQAAWVSGVAGAQHHPYVVTDPDYDLSGVPDDWPEALYEGFVRYDVPKVGLSFDESEVPQENPAYYADEMDKHPNDTSIAWRPLPGGFCDYPCDTSFAIYRPGVPFSISGLRKGRPYTGRHMPWHLTLDPCVDQTKMSVPYNEEAHYYFTHVENSSYTLPRLQGMMKEYERRKTVG